MASGSVKAVNSYLDLFNLNASDVSTLNSYHVPVYPNISLKEVSAPLEFTISGVPQVYIDLAESFLYINLKVTTADGKPLADLQDVSTTNLFLHALFDLVEIYMNGKLVSSKSFYPYTAYILSQLSFSEAYKEEVLKNALYAKDTNASEMSIDNGGYLIRKSFIAGSQAVELCGKLLEDICLQTRWVLPLVDIKIKLRRAPIKFSIAAKLDTVDYKISIEEAVFYVKNQIVSSKVVSLHERLVEKSKALYPFTRNEVKTVSVPQNATNSVTENIYSSNQLPQRIVIGFVKTGILFWLCI